MQPAVARPAPAPPLIRLALIAVGAGAIGVVLMAAPYKAFDLDRYFVPKELVLHLSAGVAAIAMLLATTHDEGRGRRAPSVALTRTDTLLVGFLVLSAASALFAGNRWAAGRALAIAFSGVLMFWAAQALARAGYARLLIVMFATASVFAAGTALLQAYGVENEYFSINRSPGGTLGNRNFVAHIAAFGTPLVIMAALGSRRLRGVVVGGLATGSIAAAVVLSRSRAAWVATAVAAAATIPTLVRAWRARQRTVAHETATAPVRGRARGTPAPRLARWTVRGVFLGTAALVGVIAALTLPNTLNWRSASPYLDSVLGVTNYRGGSGHGRLVQYATTARLAATHPLLGVGPGNWAVAYPRVAARNDPSLDPDDGMTANPWPSSDWAAFASERGLLATACLGLALLGMAVSATRAATEAADAGRADRMLPALALLATVVVVVAVGCFDAVLLLPAPTLLAWGTLGVLSGMLVPRPVTRVLLALRPIRRHALILVTALGAGAGALRSGAQLLAMALYSNAPRSTAGDATLELASRADPGNYRIHVRLAETYTQHRSCSRARSHASAARALYPSAPEPRRLLANCSAHER